MKLTRFSKSHSRQAVFDVSDLENLTKFFFKNPVDVIADGSMQVPDSSKKPFLEPLAYWGDLEDWFTGYFEQQPRTLNLNAVAKSIGKIIALKADLGVVV